MLKGGELLRPEEIRIELFKRRKQGVSMTQIGRNLNPPCSRQAVSAVIDGEIVSRRIMEAIAASIERDERTVFPEYFAKLERKTERKMKKKTATRRKSSPYDYR